MSDQPDRAAIEREITALRQQLNELLEIRAIRQRISELYALLKKMESQ